MVYRITHKTKKIKGSLELSSSKSLSNRLLIINKVGELGLHLQNPASSKDTETLISILTNFEKQKEVNVGHAGTAMRFLTALMAASEGERIITGSDRMKQRPIKELVDQLSKLGATIEYLEHEGFPPLLIKGKKLNGGIIKMKGDISSQYISALMMISPLLSQGLEIEFEGELVSKPYIDMTIELMNSFHTEINWEGNKIKCSGELYEAKKKEIYIEADWSSASYLYSIAALGEEAELSIKGLSEESLQADSACRVIFKQFNIESSFEKNDELTLKKTKATQAKEFNYDFTNCPDIAQTLAVVASCKKEQSKLSGLKTLKIKETDRIEALKAELKKVGIETICTNDSIEILPSNLLKAPVSPIKTYHDHRMALAFAPLALVMDYVDIEDPDVIEKSYPEYWDHLRALGFTIEMISS